MGADEQLGGHTGPVEGRLQAIVYFCFDAATSRVFFSRASTLLTGNRPPLYRSFRYAAFSRGRPVDAGEIANAALIASTSRRLFIRCARL